MRTVLLVVASALMAAGCSSTPMAPTASKWRLTGMVTGSTGTILSGATVSVIGGANIGRSTVADTGGRYTFASLEQGAFSLQASINGYTSTTKDVMLTRDTSLDIALAKILLADLVSEGNIASTFEATDLWRFTGHGRNRGDGCAAGISGIDQLLNGLGDAVVTRAFTLAPGFIVRPGDRFDFEGCCYSTRELDQASFHLATFTYSTVTCP